MRKSTFNELATLCGAGTLFFGFVLWTGPSGGTCGGSKLSRVDGDFASIGSAIKMYCVNNGQPPSTGQGLEALVTKPITGPKPKRWSQVMDRTPLDPWNNPFRYKLLPPTGRRWSFEFQCAGPDGFFGSGDDVAEEFEAGVIFDQAAAEEEAEFLPSY
jgi:general secretion pathway protein G